MILVFDIGNTNISAGIYVTGVDGRLVSNRKALRPRTASRSWWKGLIVAACEEVGVTPKNLRGSVICSVVPASSRDLGRLLVTLTGRPPLIVKGSLPLGLAIAYRDPDRLGADRVCAMLAAVHTYGAPVIVVDCGTAITFDGVGRGRKHCGGMISPGLAASAAALGRSTAALPKDGWPARLKPLKPVGTDTIGGVRAGVWHGAVGGIRENVRQLKSAVGKKATVVGTGGDAPALMKAAGLFDVLDPTLVLQGAAIAWCMVRGRRTRTTSRRRGGKP